MIYFAVITGSFSLKYEILVIRINFSCNSKICLGFYES